MRHLILCLIVAAVAACTTPAPRTAVPVVWTDDDRHPIEEPAEYYSGLMWDGADKIVLRQITRALLIDDFGPAKNVNVYGEVPNSSWYTNRLALGSLPIERVLRGPCDKIIDMDAVWLAKSGKVDGANPGFVIEDTSDGRRYLLKFDSFQQLPERATAADVIGSKIYWAAGFSTPCNVVVHFKRENLRLAPNASKKDKIGRKTSMVASDIDDALRNAPLNAEGRIRASASLFLPGKPIGPFTYEGTRRDDPNDVIPHEDRRELRGSRLLAAWTNHFDAREQNTFTSFISDESRRGYVQHHIIDFGDIFGSNWASDALTRRFGYASYLDPGQILTDLLTLGLIRRPWDDVTKYPEGEIFGYYDVANFEPTQWKDGYPNAAFTRMDAVDAYWAARTISRFSDELIIALTGEAKLSNPEHARYLAHVMMGRRDRIVKHYLLALSPLDSPRIWADRFCARDLLVEGGYYRSTAGTYEVRVDEGPWKFGSVTTEGDLCVDLAAEPLTVDMRVRRPEQMNPARMVRFKVRGGADPTLLYVDRRLRD